MYRLDTLIKNNRKLFHTQDLALLWKISDRNTLYTTIKRYVAKGILIAIHKGLYSTLEISKLNPAELAVAIIHDYAYVSCETILARNGIIVQEVNALTLVSRKSARFKAGNISILVRKMKDDLLYNSEGIVRVGNIFEATPKRAMVDMRYYVPKYHFDNPRSRKHQCFCQ